MTVEFTYDPKKDAANKRKHGISLSRATEFDFESAWLVVDDREDYGELRVRAIGFVGARLHVLVFTEQAERLRAISLRKATRYEATQYKENS